MEMLQNENILTLTWYFLFNKKNIKSQYVEFFYIFEIKSNVKIVKLPTTGNKDFNSTQYLLLCMPPLTGQIGAAGRGGGLHLTSISLNC